MKRSAATERWLAARVAEFLLSIVVGLGAAGLLVGTPIWAILDRRETAKQQEWNLKWVHVAVARKAIAKGQPISTELIDVRPVLGQFVTASMVKPEAIASVIGHRLLFPVDEGQPLRWTVERSFEDADDREQACVRVAWSPR